MKKVIMFPGQGSQYKGMGKGLFEKYPKMIENASKILGYDLERLCLEDPHKELGKTQFTQPALYTVNALKYMDQYGNTLPEYFIGHSLGEYNALLASGAFDFETGLKLVKKRGELMAAASGGGMAAVLGLNKEELRNKLDEGNYDKIDIANYNTPKQIVIAGQQVEIKKVVRDFDQQEIKIIPLLVNAPFHSRYMKSAEEEFRAFLENFEFNSLKTAVISNVSARPYKSGQITKQLSKQISSPVQWIDTVRFLIGKNITDYEEIGSSILTKMVKDIKRTCKPIVEEESIEKKYSLNHLKTNSNGVEHQVSNNITKIKKEDVDLGSKEFRDTYGIKYSYVAGAMYRGIASKELVVKMGKSRMLAYLGTGGMELKEISRNIDEIQQALGDNPVYGMNLLHNMSEPALEMKTVELYHKKGVHNIEASGYIQITEPLVYYLASGLEKGISEKINIKNRILAKVSRPEVAEAFMSPAPDKILNKLLANNKITKEQFELAKTIPMSFDICIEADSGGHTDKGVAMVLFPSIQRLRDDLCAKYRYVTQIRLGLAGGIGTPQSAASAFVMGADFILTGSINQCTIEAGISNTVKDLLEKINVQDTEYAPAGDMFEIGAKVQVLKKGVLFPARANKLFNLYHQYDSIDEIPQKVIAQLERSYFKKTISEIWEETKTYLRSRSLDTEIMKAEQTPKRKMALVFRWYFGFSSRLAFEGDLDKRVDFQVHTGPALGAFNQWVKGTTLENWKNRHVDEIGEKIMKSTSQLLQNTLSKITQNH
jgi:trans-AT polyketide synthase/acyltransferase/oxidoreductase domain-containing protein